MNKFRDEGFLKFTLFSLIIQSIVTPQAAQAQDIHNPSLDIRKSRIESSVKSLIKSKNLNSLLKKTGRLQDQKKTILKELNTKGKHLAKSNKVDPGKVKWHATISRARKASKLSLKPLLVFHLMGDLDDRFC